MGMEVGVRVGVGRCQSKDLPSFSVSTQVPLDFMALSRATQPRNVPGGWAPCHGRSNDCLPEDSVWRYPQGQGCQSQEARLRVSSKALVKDPPSSFPETLLLSCPTSITSRWRTGLTDTDTARQPAADSVSCPAPSDFPLWGKHLFFPPQR